MALLAGGTRASSPSSGSLESLGRAGRATGRVSLCALRTPLMTFMAWLGCGESHLPLVVAGSLFKPLIAVRIPGMRTGCPAEASPDAGSSVSSGGMKGIWEKLHRGDEVGAATENPEGQPEREALAAPNPRKYAESPSLSGGPACRSEDSK